MSPSGRLFVADWFGNQVVEYDLATQRRVGVYAGVDHGFSGPVSIAFDPAGNMLLLDRLGVLRAPLATMGFARITEGEHLGFDWARTLTVVPIQ